MIDSELVWVLVSSETQVQQEIILKPGYLPDYLSVSNNYVRTKSNVYGAFFSEIFNGFYGLGSELLFSKSKCPAFLLNKCEITMYISSRSQIFFKIGVLKHFAIFTGKHLSEGGKCFPVNIEKFLRTPFFYRIPSVVASE